MPWFIYLFIYLIRYALVEHFNSTQFLVSLKNNERPGRWLGPGRPASHRSMRISDPQCPLGGRGPGRVYICNPSSKGVERGQVSAQISVSSQSRQSAHPKFSESGRGRHWILTAGFHAQIQTHTQNMNTGTYTRSK